MSDEIPSAEMVALQSQNQDDVGWTFSWRSRIFRAIVPEKVVQTRALLQSGLTAQLTADGSIPETVETAYRAAGAALVLEHRRIAPLTLPHEWTFSMVRAAALLVDRVARAAWDYGYNMKDCHPYNVVFDGVQPCYVDFGSFIPNQYSGWRPYQKFLQYFYYPLVLWHAHPAQARLSLIPDYLIEHEQYLIHRHPFLRQLPLRLQQGLVGVSLRPILNDEVRLIGVDEPQRESRRRSAFKRYLSYTLPIERLERRRVVREIEQMAPPRAVHIDLTVAAAAAWFAPLLATLTALGPDVSAVHLLGGQMDGLVLPLARALPDKRIFCSDTDEAGLDVAYCAAAREPALRRQVSFAVFNPIRSLNLANRLPIDVRLQADLVIVAAAVLDRMVHNGPPLSMLVARLTRYARRYLTLLVQAGGGVDADDCRNVLSSAYRIVQDSELTGGLRLMTIEVPRQHD